MHSKAYANLYCDPHFETKIWHGLDFSTGRESRQDETFFESRVSTGLFSRDSRPVHFVQILVFSAYFLVFYIIKRKKMKQRGSMSNKMTSKLPLGHYYCTTKCIDLLGPPYHTKIHFYLLKNHYIRKSRKVSNPDRTFCLGLESRQENKKQDFRKV